MSRTFAMYVDNPHAGGIAFFGSSILGTDTPATTPGNLSTGVAENRIQLGEWALSTTKQSTTIHFYKDPPALRRLLESYQTQQAFQSQFAGVNSPVSVPGRPPFTGSSQLVPPTTVGPPKGIRVLNVWVSYRIATNNLAAASLTVTRCDFANGAAPVITAIPIDATALPLVANANPYLVIRAITSPTFYNIDNSTVNIELTVTTPGAAFQLDVHGIGIHADFNFD